MQIINGMSQNSTGYGMVVGDDVYGLRVQGFHYEGNGNSNEFRINTTGSSQFNYFTNLWFATSINIVAGYGIIIEQPGRASSITIASGVQWVVIIHPHYTCDITDNSGTNTLILGRTRKGDDAFVTTLNQQDIMNGGAVIPAAYFQHPVGSWMMYNNPSAGNPPGAVCVKRNDTEMRVQAIAAATTMEIDDSTGMVAGDRVSVVLDNAARHHTTIASVTDGDTVEITDPIPAGRTANVDAGFFTDLWKDMANLAA
jgi:hypothetical protein